MSKEQNKAEMALNKLLSHNKDSTALPMQDVYTIPFDVENEIPVDDYLATQAKTLFGAIDTFNIMLLERLQSIEDRLSAIESYLFVEDADE